MSGYDRGMSSILVIYDQIPKDTSFYLVPEESVTGTIRETLTVAHNAILNTADVTAAQQEAVAVVNDMCCSSPDHASDGTPKELVGFLVPFKVQDGAPPPQPVSAVFYCGWYL